MDRIESVPKWSRERRARAGLREPLLVSPLFPFAFHLCWPLYSVLPCHGFGRRGRRTLPFWRWSSCIHICTRTGVQTISARRDCKELIRLAPRSKPLGASDVRWMTGLCVCVLCYHLAATKHQGPSNPRTTYVWYHTRTFPDYRIMFSSSIKI